MITGKWYALEFDNGTKVTGRCIEQKHHHIVLDVGGKYKTFTFQGLKSLSPVGVTTKRVIAKTHV